MIVKCRSCGAEITWAKTSTGATMPVDVAPSDDGNIVLLDGPRGFLAVTLHDDERRSYRPDKKRHKAHFATCPDANVHRKPRNAGRATP
jgi:hypothetical protein